MTLRPCLDCGTPSPEPRCPDHAIDTKPTAHRRGYNSKWTALSKRARKLQPFCADCGTTEDLQADHSPEAWRRQQAGLSVRLLDIAVVCGPCNRKRGAARGASSHSRGENTRGEAPGRVAPRPPRKAKSGSHTTDGSR